MNILYLSFRNMISRPLSTTLSLVLLTLGVGMIALLLQVNRHIQTQMENNVRGIDMVVGAKGSPLQLILSAVYHIDAPTGNISLQDVKALQKNRLIALGIPLSYGDSYRGFRIVGTDHEYPALYQATVASGVLWQKTFEVTIGAGVAERLNLKIGDVFSGQHGLSEGGETHEGDNYKVAGIFNYSNSVLDQLILTATESVWEVHHHEEEEGHRDEGHSEDEHAGHGEEEQQSEEHPDEDHEEEGHREDEHADAEHREEEHNNEKHADEHGSEKHQKEHEEDKEITAMLVKFKSPLALIQLPRMINENTNMQAALPSYEISRLFGLMGVGIDTLNTIALVIMAVSGLSVFISLYSALRDRQYEMALMRTYGATRWQLVWLVLQEGLLLTATGFILGILFSRLGIWLVSGLVETNYHYSFSGGSWVVEESWLLLISLAVGLVAALLPAIRVFRFNISKTLANA